MIQEQYKIQTQSYSRPTPSLRRPGVLAAYKPTWSLRHILQLLAMLLPGSPTFHWHLRDIPVSATLLQNSVLGAIVSAPVSHARTSVPWGLGERTDGL
jgi:hypothetical protein